MRFLTRSLALVAILVLGLLAPASAGEAPPDADPEFINEINYFQCDGTTKVDNVNQQAGDDIPSWSTEAPTQSVQSGAGCGRGTARPIIGGYPMEQETTVTRIRGTFTGNVDDIQLTLYQIAPANTLYGDMGQYVTFLVDDVPVRSQVRIDDPATMAGETVSHMVELYVQDLDIIDDYYGPGNVEHTYELQLSNVFYDSGAFLAWVWGTTEVPASIEFNPDKTYGSRI